MSKMTRQLPHDMIEETLARLPVKSLVRFKCVCRAWEALISDQDFAEKQLLYCHRQRKLIAFARDIPYYLTISCDGNGRDCEIKTEVPQRLEFTDKPVLRVLGHCRGNLCLMPEGDGAIVVWNPTLNTFKTIPAPADDDPCLAAYGFGYDQSIDDYKIVKLTAQKHRGPVHVLSLKSNVWRKTQQVVRFFDRLFPAERKDEFVGTLLNENIYWHVKCWKEDRRTVVCFDLVDETVKEIPSPACGLPLCCRGSVMVLKGRLCLIESLHLADEVQFWMANETGMNIKTWSKIMTITANHLGFPCLPYTTRWFTHHNEFMMVDYGRRFFIYQPKEKVTLEVKIEYDPREYDLTEYCLPFVYVTSLVAVDGSKTIKIKKRN